MMAHPIARRFIALLVVCSTLLLAAAPLLQAAAATDTTCPCCKRAGMKGEGASCSRRHHAGSGPAMEAIPECCPQCPQAPVVSPSADYAAAGLYSASFCSPIVFEPVTFRAVVRLSSSISCSLYQRPPPLSQI